MTEPSELERDSLQALEGMKRLMADVAGQTQPGDRPATFAAIVQAFALMRIAAAAEKLAGAPTAGMGHAAQAFVGSLAGAALAGSLGSGRPSPPARAGAWHCELCGATATSFHNVFTVDVNGERGSDDDSAVGEDLDPLEHAVEACDACARRPDAMARVLELVARVEAQRAASEPNADEEADDDGPTH